jgi:pyruvate/2-oxoglutarate dehydrogenase complex dihydrolipoamide dehydrogenase (E3) component
MPDVEHFDTVILGSGQGGKLLAWHLGQSGRRVAVVERRWVGGSCPAVACMPSKNEVWSARVAYLARHADKFGIMTGRVNVDMARVRQRKEEMVKREIALHLNAYKHSGVALIMGTGVFVAQKTLQVQLNEGGKRVLRGDQIVVNVGSHAAIPDVPGLQAAGALTHIEALELDRVPAHFIMLGGGHVSIELAQAYRRFGSQVTIIESNDSLISREDEDVRSEVHHILINEGIQLVLGAESTHVHGRSGRAVSVAVQTAAGAQKIAGSDLLVAVGRIPNTADIGLERAGIELDDRGYIRVNEYLATTASGVWAIGECAGSPPFTHVSVDDFRVVKENMAGRNHSTRGRLIPYVLFTDPPLAHVGLSEKEAERRAILVRSARLPMGNVLRTEATDEKTGFMKVLVGENHDRIVGFTMIGSEAGEVMTAVQTAMLAELPYPRLRDAVIAHLTAAEGLGLLLSNVPPRSTL